MTCSLLFPSDSPLTLRAYSDSSWPYDPDTRRSTMGFCIFLESVLISWSSKRQNTISCSSTKEEYRVMANISIELKWLHQLLRDIGVLIPSHIPLYHDNKSVISIITNHVFYEHTKHIKIDCHVTRQEYTANKITFPYISTKEKVTNVFIIVPRFRYFLSKLSVIDPP